MIGWMATNMISSGTRTVSGRGRDPSLSRIHGYLAGEVTSGHLSGSGEVAVFGDRDFDPIPPNPIFQFVRGAFRNYPPGIDDRNPVRQLVRLLEVLGREQDGRAL